MSQTDVRDALGQPHRIYVDYGNEGEEKWVYYHDWYQINWFSILFNRNGRVIRTN